MLMFAFFERCFDEVIKVRRCQQCRAGGDLERGVGLEDNGPCQPCAGRDDDVSGVFKCIIDDVSAGCFSVGDGTGFGNVDGGLSHWMVCFLFFCFFMGRAFEG